VDMGAAKGKERDEMVRWWKKNITQLPSPSPPPPPSAPPPFPLSLHPLLPPLLWTNGRTAFVSFPDASSVKNVLAGFT
jgi:hypothetical protein